MPTPAVTLDYANARAGQPLGSLFTVQRRPDGLTLTKPLRPNRVLSAAVGLTGTIALAGVVTSGVLVVRNPLHPWPEWVTILAGSALLAAVAISLLLHARQLGRHRVLTVDLRRDGRMVVTNGPWTTVGHPLAVTNVRRFTVTTAGWDLLGGRVLASVNVCRRFGLHRAFLSNLPRDECAWIAGLLNAAVAGPGPTGVDAAGTP